MPAPAAVQQCRAGWRALGLWVLVVVRGLRLGVGYGSAWSKCEGLLMLGRGLLRRLVVLVVLTLATAVVVPGVMAPSASAEVECGTDSFEVDNFEDLRDAINCYNASTAVDYTITLSGDIVISQELPLIGNNLSEGVLGNLTIDGASQWALSADVESDDPQQGGLQIKHELDNAGLITIQNILLDGFCGAGETPFSGETIYGGAIDVGGVARAALSNVIITGHDQSIVQGCSSVVFRDETVGQVANTVIVGDPSNSTFGGGFIGLTAMDESAVLVTNTGVSGHLYGIALLNTAKAVVFNSTIVQNGGGIIGVNSTSTVVVNSTITYNEFGLIVSPAEESESESESGPTAEVWFSTIAANGNDDEDTPDILVPSGGVLAAGSGSLNLYSTLLSDNSLNCPNDEDGVLGGVNNFSSGDGSCPDSFETLSEGSLADFDDNGCVTTVAPLTDDSFAAFCLPTAELLASSNAVGAGDCSNVPVISEGWDISSGSFEDLLVSGVLTFDQRGFLRSGSCDAGAYQRNGIAPTSEAGSAAPVPYPGPFTQTPAPAGTAPNPVAAGPETPTAASAADDGVAGLAYTGTTTTTLAYLAVGLIGFGALLVPVSRRRN